MAVRYVLHLSRDIPGFGRPVIGGVPADIAGFPDPETGGLMKPDRAAIRAALPYRYRRAFDRCPYGWLADDGRVRFTLDGSRGQCLNTLHAFPTTGG